MNGILKGQIRGQIAKLSPIDPAVFSMCVNLFESGDFVTMKEKMRLWLDKYYALEEKPQEKARIAQVFCDIDTLLSVERKKE